MRFLLDTNILIPLEDSQLPLRENLANFVRLAHEHGHQLVYHPASETDIGRDTNTQRRKQTLDRLKQYTRLEHYSPCPWNTLDTGPNDAADNEILFALHCDAAHALITEDRGIHDKAKTRGLLPRVYTIQTAEDWLRRLYEKTCIRLPNIEDVPLYTLTPLLHSEFFDSLRDSYPTFDKWFKSKALENEKAWVAWERPDVIGAICIYSQQIDEVITEMGLKLNGPALKLSTFKVGQSVRGRKIGELFLKAAFRFASANRLENIFIHGDEGQHHFLFEMLEDFGFSRVGSHPDSNGRDAVYLKRHPSSHPPDIMEPFEYLKCFFPHFRHDPTVEKFIIPIRPEYHRILFPDYKPRQSVLFQSSNTAGNAIKLAYLCHAQTKHMNPGDVLLFYRSKDEQAITSIGIVENYDTLEDASVIAGRVKRRTVYSMAEIEEKSKKPTKVMLFRLARHLDNPIPRAWLTKNGVFKRAPESIMKISHEAFKMVLANEE